MTNDDYKQIRIVGGDGDTHAEGVVDLVKGIEGAPCFMCRHWERDEGKIASHMQANGMTLAPDGTIGTPIANDFKGRVTMRLNIRHVGWCRFDGVVTEDAATCNNFDQVTQRTDMMARLSLHDRTRNGKK